VSRILTLVEFLVHETTPKVWPFAPVRLLSFGRKGHGHGALEAAVPVTSVRLKNIAAYRTVVMADTEGHYAMRKPKQFVN
jgi:hypothetical protein